MTGVSPFHHDHFLALLARVKPDDFSCCTEFYTLDTRRQGEVQKAYVSRALRTVVSLAHCAVVAKEHACTTSAGPRRLRLSRSRHEQPFSAGTAQNWRANTALYKT
jgi:hypothetical protein